MINTCGEWDEYLELFKKNNISVINFRFKLFPYLPKDGFISSRFSYLIIILFSFFPLIKILKKEKPEFIIMHLITSLPIILNNLLKFKTKFILRISGYPKLNFFRKILWKNSSKNLFCVTSPTMDLIRDLKKKEIFIRFLKIFLIVNCIILLNFNFGSVIILNLMILAPVSVFLIYSYVLINKKLNKVDFLNSLNYSKLIKNVRFL